MDTVLQGIPHVICYIDDILVTKTSAEDHLRNPATVFERLKQHGFSTKKEKCTLFKPSIEYLGHKVDSKGIHALLSKINRTHP
jgi:hypothetical protein